jgi:hypothetical protein
MLRNKIEYLLRVLLRSKLGPTKGVEPENWSFAFNPLWQPTEGEKIDARNKQAQTDQIYITQQVLHPEEVRSSRFGGDTYSPETTLDEQLDAMDIIEASQEKALEIAGSQKPPPQDEKPTETPEADETPKPAK